MVIVFVPYVGLWDPLQMAFLWFINGVANHLLTRMILQVVRISKYS